MNFFTRKNFRILILTCVNILCMFIISHLKTNLGVIHIGSYVLPVISLQGVLTSVIALCNVLLVFTNYKVGSKIAFSLMTFSLITSIIPIFNNHTLSPLPGLISTLVSLVSVIIIYSFYKRSAINSLTDYITGLRNRRCYVNEVNARLETKQSFCLACIEIEDFKQINDIFGIQAGDFILKKTAEKLKNILDKNEMVFKITGGIFALILDEKNEPLERLKSIIKSEVVMIPPKENEDLTLEKNCIVSLAAGLAFTHPPYQTKKDASSVLHDAETALLVSRKTQNTKICVFNEAMENQELKQKEAEFLIKDALTNNYFYLVYQPQYTTGDKKLRGFETLIRCRKPDGTIISPGVFIPAAEKTNLILKIDDYVLRCAMTEFKPVLDSTGKDLTISINVSAKNIGSENFSERIKNMLEETGFPAKNLEIEITEYSFAESMETTIENILELRKLGIQIALDDFGTGYTSIAQLMKLPINLLKIDKSLIDDIETSQTMRDMVDSVIYMGHIMNCEVISEGVESEKQLDLLKKHKCDFIQGFIWGKPMSFADAELLCQQS